MKVMLDEGAFAPIRAHSTDAGLDLRAKRAIRVPAGGSAIIATGVHIELPHGCCGLLVSKSGLNIKHDITSTGLLDEGYVGEIMVKLFNHGTDSYQVEAGDKVSQLVVIPVLYEVVEIVESLDMDTERGENGFGSTGK